MTEKWDGVLRRKNDIHMEDIEKKVDSVFNFLKGEFGDEGLNNEKIEGRTTKKLRIMDEKITVQNGRLAKLEARNMFLNGSAWVIGALVTLIGIIILWIKK